jgi:hypothetical protein
MRILSIKTRHLFLRDNGAWFGLAAAFVESAEQDDGDDSDGDANDGADYDAD